MTKRKPKKLPKPVRAWALYERSLGIYRASISKVVVRQWKLEGGSGTCDDKIIPVEIRPLRKRKGVRRG